MRNKTTKMTGLLLIAALALPAAGESKTYVEFNEGSTVREAEFMTTGSGIVHEWREGDSVHIVFKPAADFGPECEEGAIAHVANWDLAQKGYGTHYTEVQGSDEGDLVDFLPLGTAFHVCIYPLDSEA